MMRRARSDAQRIWRRGRNGEWEKPTSTHRYPLFRILFIASVFLLFIFWFWSSLAVATEQPHCQYPDRTTNPVGGCDNVDPCDPTNTKFGDGSCTPAFTQPTVRPETPLEPENPVSHNIETVVESQISGELK